MLIALVCSHTGFAQNLIKGSVADTSGTPIPFCALAIHNAKDSSLVKGNVSDEQGNFMYEKIAPGNYLIKFSNVGFKTDWSPPFTVDSLSQITLPTQIMKAEGVVLKEITVATFKPTVEFKQGSVIMNIENNIISGGNTIFELLKRFPGVSIDAQNNVMVNGRGDIRFLFDGRLQQIPNGQIVNMLMSMPAESVSYIELIKNPPAKYDAAGTGGLINIVFKKAKVKGFSGSLSQSGSHGDQWRGGTFCSLNYKNNKFTLFSNLNVGYLHFETNNYFKRTLQDSAGALQMLSQGRQDPLRQYFFGTLGMEYELSKKTIISAGTNVSLANNTNQENAQVAIISPYNPFAYNYIKFNIASEGQTRNPSFNMSLQHKFDTLTQLQFAADYTNYLEDGIRFTTNNYFNNANQEVLPGDKFGSIAHTDFNIYTQKLDLTRAMKKGYNFESGVKSSFVRNAAKSNVQFSNSVGELVTDTGYSNQYHYNERILAAYVSMSRNFKKLGIKSGLRTEHTLADGNNYPKNFSLRRDYINFFPNFSFDYKFNDKNSVMGAYGYYIGRPRYDQMSPSRGFNDRFSNGSGNPSLKPQFSHSANLDYNFNSIITLSTFVNVTNNSIYYYAYGDTKTKATVDSIFNFEKISNGGVSLFAQKQIKWFNFNVFGIFLYRDNATLANGHQVTNRSNLWFVNGSLEFMLPKDIKIQLQGHYNSWNFDGIQTYHPMGVMNFTIFKSFFNKKLDLSMSIYDVFYTDKQPWENKLGGLSTYYNERNDTRRIRLFIVWKFGKMRINSNLKRSNKEESGRLKSVG